jgi:hypothetical protein
MNRLPYLSVLLVSSLFSMACGDDGSSDGGDVCGDHVVGSKGLGQVFASAVVEL